MFSPPVVALALVANVLARTAYHRAGPTVSTQTVTYSSYYDVYTEPEGSRIRVSHHDCDFTPQKNVNRNQHNDDTHEAVNEHRSAHRQPAPVYTNGKRSQHQVKTKLTEKLDYSTERGGVVLHDNINYDQTLPFTNENRSESGQTPKTNTQAKSTDPGARPGVTHVTKPPQISPSSSHGGAQHKQTTPRPNETSTEAEFTLEDRVAFTGDQCPTGYAKVNGKCVERQD